MTKFDVKKIQNNQSDYELMETFISAIQKLFIKDVVLYGNRKINATKKLYKKARGTICYP